jgi:hypothetical protein
MEPTVHKMEEIALAIPCQFLLFRIFFEWDSVSRPHKRRQASADLSLGMDAAPKDHGKPAATGAHASRLERAGPRTSLHRHGVRSLVNAQAHGHNAKRPSRDVN